MNELALFAGAGGGILGGKLLGWRTVCAVEWEAYPASVLCARQNDGLLPPFPIWDDVQTFDGHPWRGIVDVISGGFPCQDISAAGKGAGIDGERSGMWGEMARIIREVRPRYVFVENSPMLTSRGLGRVLGDLASMGFDAKWGVLGAADVGANHQRDRIWIVGKVGNTDNNGQIAAKVGTISTQGSNSNKIGQEQASKSKGSSEQYAELADSKMSNDPTSKNQIGHRKGSQGEFRRSCGIEGEVYNPNSTQFKRNECAERNEQKYSYACCSSWWKFEPNVGRVADGVAARVDRLKSIGNGQVPLCAATAWRILTER